MSVTGIIAKSAGIVGLGLIGYDAHKYAKEESSATQKTLKADGLADSYVNTLTLDTPSTVKSKVKNGIFHMHLEENMSDFFNGISGYGKGFFSTLVSYAIPLTLSLGTLMGSWKNLQNPTIAQSAKKLVSKACGAGLIAYGAISLLRISGLTKPSELGRK